ncbi:MAG: DNA alkylation repair protein [Oscillospiraceae bacterium]|jgi:3-methyladenine DNA glycosylase AlkD|nr:DNA alkylation repair protein [Oscillospiraceae bacterium]
MKLSRRGECITLKFNIIWDKENYSEFLLELEKLQDHRYRSFCQRLNKDENYDYIGVRVPILRDIAKQIAKYDFQSFIRQNTHTYYEETMLHGFILGYADLELKSLLKMLKEYIQHVSNWSLVDLVIVKFKSIVKNKTEGFSGILEFSKSSNPWEVRMALVLLLSLYVEEKYIEEILSVCSSINKNHLCCLKNSDDKIPYYVNMANAWLLSECYLKFPEKVTKLFKEKALSPQVHNKAIQKIRESWRVNNCLKNNLKDLKIKLN